MEINIGDSILVILKAKAMTMLRAMAGAKGWPVVVVDGDQPPTRGGTKAHYTTITGRPIHFPNAYAKKGRSSMVYHGSTRAVTVGMDWLKAAVWTGLI